jgi:hypothetical protein
MVVELVSLRVTACRSCGSAIIWTVTERGKRMPVDAQPLDSGTVQLVGNAFGESVALSRVLSGDSLTAAREQGAPLHRSHFASCPEANVWRRPRMSEAHAR